MWWFCFFLFFCSICWFVCCRLVLRRLCLCGWWWVVVVRCLRCLLISIVGVCLIFFFRWYGIVRMLRILCSGCLLRCIRILGVLICSGCWLIGCLWLCGGWCWIIFVIWSVGKRFLKVVSCWSCCWCGRWRFRIVWKMFGWGCVKCFCSVSLKCCGWDLLKNFLLKKLCRLWVWLFWMWRLLCFVCVSSFWKEIIFMNDLENSCLCLICCLVCYWELLWGLVLGYMLFVMWYMEICEVC